MPKDPAILWYWSDWGGGTKTFTRHMKGCYMDLLEAQFNAGPLSLEEIRTVLGTDFGQAWPTLQKKFSVTNTGRFYNERMEKEKEKRKKFTDGRRENLRGKPPPDEKPPHMDAHMDNRMGAHMENENRNNSGMKDGGPGEGSAVVCFDIEKYLREHEYDFELIVMGSQGLTADQVWKVVQKFHLWCQQKSKYPDRPLALIAGVKLWIINEKSFKNGIGSGNQKRGSSNRKNAGTEELIESGNRDLAAWHGAQGSGDPPA